MQTTISPPSPGRLYRRIALSAARHRLTPRARDAALPELTLQTEHPGIAARTADRYTRLMAGRVYDGSTRRSLASVLIHTAGFPLQMALMSRPEFPLPLLGLVHLSNRVEHRRPILAEEPLRISVHARALAAHRRGTQVEIVTEVSPAAEPRAAGGTGSSAASSSTSGPEEPAWTGVSVYLCRGIHLAGAVPPEDVDGASPRVPEELPPKTALWRFPVGAGRRYAAVSGDYNPIHLASPIAKSFGMRGAIVHGMYAAGLALEGREPERAGHRWEIGFGSPIVMPAAVAFGVEQLADPAGPEAPAGAGGPDAARPVAGGQRFAGWDPRTGREHFRGRLTLPGQE